MAKRIIRVGSRESTLAVAQTRIVMEQIQAHHPELELELVTMKTTGDKILDKALDKIGGKGLFVKELDRALREGRIDISVHSLKDMPMQTPEDLPILAYDVRVGPGFIVHQGEDGYLAAEGDEASYEKRLLEMMAKPELLREMGRRALLHGREFSREKVAEKWFSVIET